MANYTSGSGTATLTFNYTVAAGQNTADLDYASTAALALNGGSIQDAAGNAAVLTLPATGTDGLATQNIVIDTTPPTVTAVSTTAAANRATRRATTVPITVTFGKAVNGDGHAATDAQRRGGGQLLQRQRHGDADLQPIPWRPGQNTADLDYASTAALALNGGSIQDCGGQRGRADPAGHRHGRPGNAEHRHRHDAADGDARYPRPRPQTGVYAAGTTIPITVTFSEAVTVTGTPQLTLNDGAVVNYTSGSGTTTLTFNYTVAAGQNTADLDYASTAALRAQRRDDPGPGGQRGRADPAGHRHGRPGDPRHRHRHDGRRR